MYYIWKISRWEHLSPNTGLCHCSTLKLFSTFGIFYVFSTCVFFHSLLRVGIWNNGVCVCVYFNPRLIWKVDVGTCRFSSDIERSWKLLFPSLQQDKAGQLKNSMSPITELRLTAMLRSGKVGISRGVSQDRLQKLLKQWHLYANFQQLLGWVSTSVRVQMSWGL